MTGTKLDILEIELAEAALAGGWAVAARTADVTARLMSRPQDNRGVSDSIAFMANEIVENSVKFRMPESGPVTVTAWQDGTDLHFDVTNTAPTASAAALGRLRHEITTHDAGDLLIERIEANALSNRDEGSGLGILTLLNDYGATIDWTIGAIDAEGSAKVTTHVTLPIE